MGSLYYLAPEVITGRDNSATPALDIWSIGVIIYVLLTAKMPFDGNERPEIAQKIVNLKYKKLSKFPNISKPWNKLVCGCLRPDPSKRWTLIDIGEHIYRYRMNPDAPCEDPSDDEEVAKPTEEKKPTPKSTPKNRRKTVPGTKPVPPPLKDVRKGSGNDLNKPGAASPRMVRKASGE